MTPGECAVGEGACDGGKCLEPLHDVGKVLELATGKAEALAGIVVETDEAEPLVAATEAKPASEDAEDAAAEGLLTGEATKKRVDLRGVERPVDAITRGRQQVHDRRIFGEDRVFCQASRAPLTQPGPNRSAVTKRRPFREGLP